MSGIAFILARLVLPVIASDELIERASDAPAVTGSDIVRVMRHQVGLDRTQVSPRPMPAGVIHWCPRCVIFAPKRSDSLIEPEPDLFHGLP